MKRQIIGTEKINKDRQDHVVQLHAETWRCEPRPAHCTVQSTHQNGKRIVYKKNN